MSDGSHDGECIWDEGAVRAGVWWSCLTCAREGLLRWQAPAGSYTMTSRNVRRRQDARS